jgi:hypothetical protein
LLERVCERRKSLLCSPWGSLNWWWSQNMLESMGSPGKINQIRSCQLHILILLMALLAIILTWQVKTGHYYNVICNKYSGTMPTDDTDGNKRVNEIYYYDWAWQKFVRNLTNDDRKWSYNWKWIMNNKHTRLSLLWS